VPASPPMGETLPHFPSLEIAAHVEDSSDGSGLGFSML